MDSSGVEQKALIRVAAFLVLFKDGRRGFSSRLHILVSDVY